ncbi:hypothetical protein PQX77_019682 [Marasmius sp. AFHP31]|nr:hypothetical protein PQX77_019682 [Marasmius sp. AFHP31]
MASPKPETRPAKSTPGPDSEPPPKVKRKAGRESPFSESQQACIAAKFPEWEDLLVAHQVQFGKDGRKADPPAVRDWVNSTADALLTLPEFGDLNLAMKDRKGWKTSLLDAYKNYRHHVVIPKYTALLVEDYLRNHVISAFQQGPSTAKAIFAQENAHKIQEVASDLLVKDKTLNGCNAGAHAKALTDLWKAADHATYEQKARDQVESHDIYENLETFSQGLHATLSEVASHGLLGNLEICLILDFQELLLILVLGSIEVSSEHESEKFIKDDPSGTRASFEDAWCRWIEQKIKPNNPTPELDSRIRKNTAGIPILSGLDIEKAVTEDLHAIVESWLTSLWYQSSGQKNVPYDAIAADPSKFYDTEHFNLPVPLGPPRTILPGPFYILVDFFTKLDPSTPFVFLPHPEQPSAASNRDADQEIPLSLDPLSLQDSPIQPTGTDLSQDPVPVPPAVFDPKVGNPTRPTLLNRVEGDIATESLIGPEHLEEPMNVDPTSPGSEPVIGGDMEAEGSSTQGAASHQQTSGQEIAATVTSRPDGVMSQSISDPRTEVQDVGVKPPRKSRSRNVSGKRKPSTRKDRYVLRAHDLFPG